MINILAEIKADNKMAEEWLLLYPARLKQFYQDRKDILYSAQVQKVEVSNSRMSDFVVNKAVRLAKLENVERWLKIIELVEETLSEEKKIFLECRRETAFSPAGKGPGRPAWVVYVQKQYAERMAEKYNTAVEKFWVSETTIKNWWNEVVNLTARVAIKKQAAKKIL